MSILNIFEEVEYARFEALQIKRDFNSSIVLYLEHDPIYFKKIQKKNIINMPILKKHKLYCRSMYSPSIQIKEINKKESTVSFVVMSGKVNNNIHGPVITVNNNFLNSFKEVL